MSLLILDAAVFNVSSVWLSLSISHTTHWHTRRSLVFSLSPSLTHYT